jgi:hypothetical protein
MISYDGATNTRESYGWITVECAPGPLLLPGTGYLGRVTPPVHHDGSQERDDRLALLVVACGFHRHDADVWPRARPALLCDLASGVDRIPLEDGRGEPDLIPPEVGEDILGDIRDALASHQGDGDATSELAFEGLRLSAESIIGEEGEGFRYIIDGMNAELVLIAAKCVGGGRWFVEKATQRAGERAVFGRRIGENQGIQFPISRAYANVEAASLMVEKAASLFDRREPCGAEANLAKLLAADASWEAANAALQTFGGYGFDAEYDVERKFRETRLYQVAPISTNLTSSLT